MATRLYEYANTETGGATSQQCYDASLYPEYNYLGQYVKVGLVSTNEPFNIDKISLYLNKIGTITGNLIVEIRTVSSSNPTQIVQCSGTITCASITALGWYDCDNFAGDTTLLAGTEYAIIIYTSEIGDDANTILWNGSVTLSYGTVPQDYAYNSGDNGVSWGNIVDSNTLSTGFFKIYGQTFLGTLCTYQDVVNKAGAGANSTAKSVTNVSNYVKQAESVVNDRTRKDWTTLYSSLSSNKKYILNEIVSDFAAIKVIQYDMSGYTTRLEAVSMIEELRKDAEKLIQELKDEDVQKFIIA